MNCIYCGSHKTKKDGKTDSGIRQRYKCKKCGRRWVERYENSFRSARILLLDIETLPGEYYSWGPRVEYIQPDMQIKPWAVSCWAAKWLFEPEIMGEVVNHKEAFARTEQSILGGIWKLMDEAHIIVTQNGIRFDIKRLNTKFIENGYTPPSPYKNVDTLVTAQGVFAWDYNRLDEVGQRLGIGKKIDMSWKDWEACLTNDKQADEHLQHMLTYCKRDVAPLLEDVYLKMLPWIKSHPNLNVYTNVDQDKCPKCESIDLKWTGEYATPQGLWEGFRCNACGATGRGTRKDHNIKKTGIKAT